LFAKYLDKISFTRLDLPEPETQVTTTKFARGIVTSIFFKLFSFAQSICKTFPFFSKSLNSGLNHLSTITCLLCVKYGPVIDLELFMTSSKVPSAIIFPQSLQAFGQISII